MFAFLKKLSNKDVYVNNIELSLFISSTFQDMQGERDILVRFVIPRIKELFLKRNILIREVDLRWGITKSMNQDEGAVEICLDEIERCSPLVFCMVGHRVGWKPSLHWLDDKKKNILSIKKTESGLTELEIEYAKRISEIKNSPKPIIVFRSSSLSKDLNYFDGSTECQSYRNRVIAFAEETKTTYNSLKEFEALSEKAIQFAIEQQIEKEKAVKTKFLENNILKRINNSKKHHPILIFYRANTGISWSLEQYKKIGKSRSIIDGKKVKIDSVAFEISKIENNDSRELINNTNISVALESLQRRHTVILDHFEEAFEQRNRANLSLLPSQIINNNILIVCTKEDHIKNQAVSLGWTILDFDLPSAAENADLADSYLSSYRKNLTPVQKQTLSNANWIRDIGTVMIVMDELRKFGNIEHLSSRLSDLASQASFFEIFSDILQNTRSPLPIEYHDSFDMILIALSVTDTGLNEEELYFCIMRDNTSSLEISSLWSLFKISFRSILNYKNNNIYISKPEIIENLPVLISSYESKTRIITDKLEQFLQQKNKDKWFMEALNIIYVRDGHRGLKDFLSKPKNTIETYQRNGIGVKSWLSTLDKRTKIEIVSSWMTNQHLSYDEYWMLSQIALNKVPNDLTLKLLSNDQNEKRATIRKIITSELTIDEQHFNKIKLVFLSEKDHELDLNHTLMLANSFLNGQIDFSSKELDNLYLCLEKEYLETPYLTLQCQTLLSLGNLDLHRARWKSATKIFTKAISISRTIGSTELLCRSLERSAVSFLELNKFKKAKSLILECKYLAEEFNQTNMEIITFEILIPMMVRLGEWSKAYNLVEEFNSRCRILLGDTSKAKSMLELIEEQAKD